MARKDGTTLQDVNADLVGMKFKSDHGLLVVIRTWPLIDSFMECEGRDQFKTLRSVSRLREHRLLHA